MTCKGIARTDLYKELGEKFIYEEKADLMNLSKYINSTGVGDFGHNLRQRGIFIGTGNIVLSYQSVDLI